MKNYIDSIALFGTSADPPTFGHEALLKGLLNIFPKVVTWASDNPGKTHSLPLTTRQQLLRALVEDIDHPKLEMVQNLSSPWAITTLERAESQWSKSSLFFVIGSDLTGQIISWRQVEDVLKKATIGIAIRDGWPISDSHLKDIEFLGGIIDLLPLKIPASSSSIIRERFNPSQVPKAILPLLKSQNIYGVKQEEI